MVNAALLLLGGALGTLARYSVSHWAHARPGNGGLSATHLAIV